MTARKDDPAFIYFPTNYRWSMGLLLCLSGAPWGGAEIDDVNRVGRALAGHIGDDDAWFEEWTRMGDRIEARGREAETKRPQTHRRLLPDARGALLPDRRALPAADVQGACGLQEIRCSRFAPAPRCCARPRIESVEVPYGGKSLPALFVHPDPDAAGKKPAPAMVFFDGFDITKEIQYFKARPRSRRARHRLSDRRRPRQRRERALPRSAADRRNGTICAPPPTNISPRAARSIPNASASWRSASAATTRRARPRSSRALPPASPGARNGTITMSGSGASRRSTPAKCSRSRCRPST